MYGDRCKFAHAVSAEVESEVRDPEAAAKQIAAREAAREANVEAEAKAKAATAEEVKSVLGGLDVSNSAASATEADLTNLFGTKLQVQGGRGGDDRSFSTPTQPTQPIQPTQQQLQSQQHAVQQSQQQYMYPQQMPVYQGYQPNQPFPYPYPHNPNDVAQMYHVQQYQQQQLQQMQMMQQQIMQSQMQAASPASQAVLGALPAHLAAHASPSTAFFGGAQGDQKYSHLSQFYAKLSPSSPDTSVQQGQPRFPSVANPLLQQQQQRR